MAQAASDFEQFPTITTTLEDRVLTATLNRPDRLNAFDRQMNLDMLALYEAVDRDDRVGVVIVTGAGRGFCAGADLSGGGGTFDTGAAAEAENDDAPKAAPRDGGGLVTLRIFECKKVVIAAINGPAVGVGITHTLPMDIRLASEKAKFGFVFARRGLVPEAASSWFLPRVVGIAKSMEWVATGRVFGPEEALAGGLVSEVLPVDQLLPRAREIAREIVENTSPMSIALSRHLLWKMLGASHPMEAHRIDSQAIHFLGSGPEAREGVESFLQKRAPNFTSKPSEDMPDFFPWWEEPSYEDG